MSKKDERLGKHFITNEGYEIVIIEYKDANNVLIQFQDEYKTIIPTTYHCCESGEIRNPYHPNKYGGYIGVGVYKSKENNKTTKCFQDWSNMIKRGYDEELKNKYPTYKEVIVYEGWHNFQNFAEWWHNNYYEVEGERMCLDKDILIKGNKEYAPDKCIFVPERINTLFVKQSNKRNNLPIGVCYHKRDRVYQASCNTLNGNKYLGSYLTSEQAFLAYKEFKEDYIKQVADEYKGRIPDRLYEAMYTYEVEITD